MTMKAAAIIAEYNPFHNGHKYHIERTRALGATHIAAIMSGDFVQRGDCACASKWTRAEMALSGGADLVLELPLPWSMAGAEKFAQGGVAVANALGCIDMLSFGSECGDIGLIKRVSELPDADAFREALRPHLDSGITFAAARQLACETLLPQSAEILRSPNDALAVEYCRAINRLGSEIEPVCIRREGAEHDGGAEGGLASASFLRRRLAAGEPVEGYIPPEVHEILMKAVGEGETPALTERLDRTVLYVLRTMGRDGVASLPDVSEGLENRIADRVCEAGSFAELCDMVKTKRYTHARIRRVLLSALLGLTAADAEELPSYIRVLAMNSRGREMLSAARPSLPVVTRYADLARLDGRGRRIFELGMRAADIFGLCAPETVKCGTDASHGVIVRQ